jgi:hypothetical protein
LLSFAACVPDPGLRAVLPFAASEINREAIPPLIRRRTSQATQLAFSAAEQACRLAGRSPSALSAIFASLGAEIQTTDQICLEIANPEGVVSPNAFHNSVQNAAVGYWSIVQQCTQAASALSAGEDTFAMGLLEAWCQLACQGGELLLVCYDEVWPPYLAPGRGKAACACALVLAAGAAEGALMHIDRPELGAEILPTGWHALPGQMPPLSAIPLLSMASGGMAQTVPLSIRNPGWQVRATPCRV